MSDVVGRALASANAPPRRVDAPGGVEFSVRRARRREESLAMPAIRNEDRIVVIDRRLFRDDNTRIYVAVVEEFDESVIRARGFVYHVSPYEVSGTERRGEERTRLISLSAGDIIYLLPRDIDVSKLQLRRSPKSLALSDGVFTLDLSDFLLRA